MPKRIAVGEGTAAIMKGEVDVSEWDDEELRRGRKRSKRGDFRGRPSAIVPRQVYDELRRRTAHEFYEMVRQELIPTMEVVVAMARGDIEPDPTRLKACEQIINRFAGKAPERVEISAQVKPWEEALSGGIIRDVEPADDEDEDENIIDAEVVEDDDEDWDDD